MLSEVIDWSERTELKRIELTVHTTNLRALGLYLRAGFQVEGVRRNSLRVDGEFVNEYLMSRLRDA
jgi:RimJ/RimL family protein N-acetyltransferase